jgi:hypothetical protein
MKRILPLCAAMLAGAAHASVIIFDTIPPNGPYSGGGFGVGPQGELGVSFVPFPLAT